MVAEVWWLHPGKLLLGFLLPVYLFLVFAVPEFWPQLVVLRSRNYLDLAHAVLGAAAILTLAAGSMLGARLDLFPVRGRPVFEVGPRLLYVLGGLTLVAYTIWFWPILASGRIITQRDELNATPGITSFGQFGVPFVTCYAYVRWGARQQLPRSLHALFAAVVVMTVARVYLWSERLALIEMSLAGVIAFFSYARPQRGLLRTGMKLVARYGPLLGLPLLMAFFTATEFVRSWSSPSYRAQNLNLGEFMVARLVTYYYTSINNGAGLLATSDWPSYELYHVLNWFYRLPFGIGAFFYAVLQRDASPADVFLYRYGDPEFNNMSGIFPIFYDLGVAGGLLYFSSLGLIAGMLYRGMRRGTRLGVMFFPSMFVATIECLRILYLNHPRAFLVLVGALAATTQLRRRKSPADYAPPAQAELPRPPRTA
jgi:hypothetical protein